MLVSQRGDIELLIQHIPQPPGLQVGIYMYTTWYWSAVAMAASALGHCIVSETGARITRHYFAWLPSLICLLAVCIITKRKQMVRTCIVNIGEF